MIEVNNQSAVFQLQGGITVANPVVLTSSGDWAQISGIDTTGAVQSISGANTLTADLILAFARPGADNVNKLFGVGALSGATLTLGNVKFDNAGGSTNRNTIFQVNGAGNIVFTGILDNVNGSVGTSELRKYSTGTLTFNAANSVAESTLQLYRGTTIFQGAATAAGATSLNVFQNAVLTFDDTVTYTTNRLANKPLQILGGTVNFLPAAAGSGPPDLHRPHSRDRWHRVSRPPFGRTPPRRGPHRHGARPSGRSCAHGSRGPFRHRVS